MPKKLYNNRTNEFKEFVSKNHRLPKVWEIRFSDGEDMRLWFNKLFKVDKFHPFILEIDSTLQQFNSKILNDNEKEQEFLEYGASIDIGTQNFTHMI